MIHRVTLTPEAIRDFQNLYDHLWPRAGERAANTYIGNLYAYCMNLSMFPQRGMLRDDLHPGIYRVHTSCGAIEVPAAVRHPGRPKGEPGSSPEPWRSANVLAQTLRGSGLGPG